MSAYPRLRQKLTAHERIDRESDTNPGTAITNSPFCLDACALQ